MRIAQLALLAALLVTFVGCRSAGPNPNSFDASELPNGTGERVFSYDSGAVMLREDYANGQLVRSRWFKPNGELVQQTDWVNGTGEGLYLREDGSVHVRMKYTNGLAHGAAIYYDSSGGIAKVVIYENGVPAEY